MENFVLSQAVKE